MGITNNSFRFLEWAEMDSLGALALPNRRTEFQFPLDADQVFVLAARIYYILYFSCFIPAPLISNFTRIFNRNTFIVINSYRLTLLVINHHHKIRKSDAKCCHTKADQFKKTFGSKLPNFASSIYQFLVLIFEHITENFPDEILENQM